MLLHNCGVAKVQKCDRCDCFRHTTLSKWLVDNLVNMTQTWVSIVFTFCIKDWKETLLYPACLIQRCSVVGRDIIMAAVWLSDILTIKGHEVLIDSNLETNAWYTADGCKLDNVDIRIQNLDPTSVFPSSYPILIFAQWKSLYNITVTS